MSEILKKEFRSLPGRRASITELNWRSDQKGKIEIVGETHRPYKAKTKSGKPKQTDVEIITIYYKEK